MENIQFVGMDIVNVVQDEFANVIKSKQNEIKTEEEIAYNAGAQTVLNMLYAILNTKNTIFFNMKDIDIPTEFDKEDFDYYIEQLERNLYYE